MKKLVFIFWLSGSSNLLFGQPIPLQVISSAGVGNHINLSWTIGEPIISTLRTTKNILTQGFHQTDLMVVSVDENIEGLAEIIVFPNPAYQNITIRIKNIVSVERLYIIDITGKTMYTALPITLQGDIHIDVSEYPAGIYIIKIREKDGKTYRTARIQKINMY